MEVKWQFNHEMPHLAAFYGVLVSHDPLQNIRGHEKLSDANKESLQ